MPREIVFGNQTLLVAFDKDYIMRDIYFPHVGSENHLNGNRNRIGIWIDNRFSWLDSNEWHKEIHYEKETSIGNSKFINPSLNLEMTIRDGVHIHKNIFIRKIIIQNNDVRAKKIKFFFSHDLQIGENDIGVTAYYDPDTKAIIHFLKDRYFLIGGSGNENHINSFATGKSHYGKEGTFKDAEDGILSENPIDQGSVDSTVQIDRGLPPNGNAEIRYWMVAGKSYRDVESLHNEMNHCKIDDLFDEVCAYDKVWSNKNNLKFHSLSENIIELFKRSLLVIKTQTDHDGSIIAANDSDILQFNRDHYSYMWPRDGALVAFALDKAGYHTLTRKFFKFCARVVGPSGVLLHKYNPDGTPGSTWHPWYEKDVGKVVAIQEDETALVIYALWKHYEKIRDLDFINSIYREFIQPAGDFLEDFRIENGLPKPSYDLWEERRGILTFTCSAVYAGLIGAANFAHIFGDETREERYVKAAEEVKEAMVEYLYDKEKQRFLRMINFNKDGSIEKDFVIDASLYAIFEFGVFPPDDPLVRSTMECIEQRLWIKTDVGGVARYENDYYHQISKDIEKVPGNPWFICTLWLAEYYIHLSGANSIENGYELMNKARDLMEWVASRVLDSGILAEQVHPYNNQPISVSPLTWSHATFVLAVMEYLEKWSEIKVCDTCGRKLPIFQEYHGTK